MSRAAGDEVSTLHLSTDMQRLLYEGIEQIVDENKDKSPKYVAEAIVNFIDSHFWIE